MFIYDILLGPHFVTHVPWAGTFLKDFVLHIFYVIYSTTHIYAIYSVTCICVIYCTTWWTYTYSTNCWTELDDWNEIFSRVMSAMALMIFLLIDMRMWYLLLSSRAGFGFDISFVETMCLYTSVLRGVEQWYLNAIYGRWHGLCLYCAWFIYRGTCWHAVMIFNVVIHLSWCAILLTIWTSYWINGIHLLSCPHGQGSSQKRGSNF